MTSPQHPAATRIALSDGGLRLYASWFAEAEADALFAALLERVAWRSEEIVLFGKRHQTPRRTAYYGDPEAAYTYSGNTWTPLPWLPELRTVRERIAPATPEVEWNAVLANLYRDGRDSMGWHADDEPELGPAPWIASVSFGAERTFRLKRKDGGGEPVNVELTHGSLLVMEPPTQAHWVHALPKRLRVTAPRVNLTFRRVGVARTRSDA
ncbi:MAG: alpha-ketoglutarate-dependent dioxygenase AlkB [Planctomycetota bacterium]|nr:alpha-ketoglutarate-dependent dioxygenase AlkB [Planctomycetota bacterium]